MLHDLAVPDFEAASTGGKTFALKQARGKPLVLYFYPKDNTPGCTDEGRQFRDLYPKLASEAKVPLVPFLLEGVAENPDLFQPDQLHPTAPAQGRIVDNVWKVIEPLLRKRAS